MRSNQTCSSLFLAVLLASPLGAALTEDEPMVRADLGYATKYVFRGLEQAGASTQASLELSRENFRGGLGANLPLKGRQGQEMNLSASYSWVAGKGLTLEISARNYWLAGTAVVGVGHSFEAGIIATVAPISGYTPRLAYYRDLRLRADTSQVSLTHSIALTGIGAFLDLNFFAGWRQGADWQPDLPGPRHRDGYGYWGAEAYLPYRIPGSRFSLITGLHFADTVGRSPANGPYSSSGGRNLWLTLGVSLDF